MKHSMEKKRKLVLRYQSGESVTDICTETGIAKSTFYSWIKTYRTIGLTSDFAITPKEVMLLKKRLEKLEGIIAVLKAVDCTVSSPLQDKLKALEKLYGQYSVHTLCDALEVPRGTFYNHILRNKKENTSYQFRRVRLSEMIRQIYDESNQIYGAAKIQAILRVQGIIASERMVAELMGEMNLVSIRNGAKANHARFASKVKKDRIKLNFSASAPNRVWVSDVTHYILNEKTYYICAIIPFCRRV